jgi:hypothetical protein
MVQQPRLNLVSIGRRDANMAEMIDLRQMVGRDCVSAK